MYYYCRFRRGSHPLSLVKGSNIVEIRKKAYNDLKNHSEKEIEIWYYRGKDVMLDKESGIVFDPRSDKADINDWPVGEAYFHKTLGGMWLQYKGDGYLPVKELLPDGNVKSRR